MFDHIGLRTAEFARLKLFYEAALQPLALAVLAEYPGGVGFGRDGQPAFWIGESERAPSSVHIAFQAQSHADVDAFYAAAMNAGAVDNGAPGLRPHFHADYYGAFVLPCARTQWPVAMELGRTRCGRSNRGLLARCQGGSLMHINDELLKNSQSPRAATGRSRTSAGRSNDSDRKLFRTQGMTMP